MQYKDYLQSEHWKNKRKEVISKQGNRCRICNSDKNLNIHHRTYRQYGKSILGKELNSFLLPLCRECHMLWHKYHGFKRIPFPSIRWKLQAGVPKELAFQKPSTSIKTLLKSTSANDYKSAEGGTASSLAKVMTGCSKSISEYESVGL